MKLRKFKDWSKADKRVFIILSVILWIMVVWAILDRYFSQLFHYEISILNGLFVQLLSYYIMGYPLKKRN